jgi:hypothetical protein
MHTSTPQRLHIPVAARTQQPLIHRLAPLRQLSDALAYLATSQSAFESMREVLREFGDPGLVAMATTIAKPTDDVFQRLTTLLQREQDALIQQSLTAELSK